MFALDDYQAASDGTVALTEPPPGVPFIYPRPWVNINMAEAMASSAPIAVRAILISYKLSFMRGSTMEPHLIRVAGVSSFVRI